MNSDNSVTKDTLEEMRLKVLYEKAEYYQKAIDSLRPQDTALRREYKKYVENANKEIEEIEKRGLRWK